MLHIALCEVSSVLLCTLLHIALCEVSSVLLCTLVHIALCEVSSVLLCTLLHIALCEVSFVADMHWWWQMFKEEYAGWLDTPEAQSTFTQWQQAQASKKPAKVTAPLLLHAWVFRGSEQGSRGRTACKRANDVQQKTARGECSRRQLQQKRERRECSRREKGENAAELREERSAAEVREESEEY